MSAIGAIKVRTSLVLFATCLISVLAMAACDKAAIDNNNAKSDSDNSKNNQTAADVNATAIRPAENKGAPDKYDHWIGRNVMTSSSVELVWSEIKGDSVSYRIHRFERNNGFNPDTAALSDATAVYVGDATTWTDTKVKPDQFYTYVLDARVDKQTLPRRWTEALTSDDTEAPSAITGLRAEINADGVLLSWGRSSDNVEFAAYSVSIVEPDRLKYIGGGADIEQTSFLDNRPESGLITYAVVAVDFHDNRTEAATITVNIP